MPPKREKKPVAKESRAEREAMEQEEALAPAAAVPAEVHPPPLQRIRVEENEGDADMVAKPHPAAQLAGRRSELIQLPPPGLRIPVDRMAAAAFRRALPPNGPDYQIHVLEERARGSKGAPESNPIVYHMAVLGGSMTQMRNQVCFRQLLVSERDGVLGEHYYMYTRIGPFDGHGSADESGNESGRLVSSAARFTQLKGIWNERFHDRTKLRWSAVAKDRTTFNAPNMTLLPLPPRM